MSKTRVVVKRQVLGITLAACVHQGRKLFEKHNQGRKLFEIREKNTEMSSTLQSTHIVSI